MSNPHTLEALLTRILVYYPRETEHQRFRLRLASKFRDLPPWPFGESLEFDATSIQIWILKAIDLNPFAAIVLLDAMDFLTELLRFLSGNREFEYLDSRFKRDFTDGINGTGFVFRVPAGGELKVFGESFTEGVYGIGYLLRCHLSQSTSHENWGLGRWFGSTAYEDFATFGVACEIGRELRQTSVEGNDPIWNCQTVTATIPLKWIQQRAQLDDKLVRCLCDMPNEAEIIRVADEAIGLVREHYEQMRKASQRQ